ncbi:hypothetical protein GQ55_4G075700 [Panicum hallii var. hallii]|uniref:Secreted protein n=1 Tax=Panicum hallii var. hallii TaxID=1504633 RepID=A0A2T7DW84_9POAL|nr:hypothetical protein GQ55_4G075700 [Panicum hallii var. hallii]
MLAINQIPLCLLCSSILAHHQCELTKRSHEPPSLLVGIISNQSHHLEYYKRARTSNSTIPMGQSYMT